MAKLSEIVDINQSAYWVYTIDGSFGNYDALRAAAGKRIGGMLAFIRYRSTVQAGKDFYVGFTEFKEAWGWCVFTRDGNQMTMLSDADAEKQFGFDFRDFLANAKSLDTFKNIIKQTIQKNLTTTKLDAFYNSLDPKPKEELRSYRLWFNRALKFLDRQRIDLYHNDRTYTFTVR